MKQFILLFAFFGLVSIVNVNAQCGRSAAAKMAAMSDDIITKKDATTGEVTYLKKSVCAASGTVSYTNVEYCSKTAQFINVAPAAKYSCVKSATACSKTYSQSALMVSNEQAAAAKKRVVCLLIKKTATAKASFVSLENKVIKP